MYLSDIAYDSFILLDENQAIDDARRLVENLKASHVIAWRRDDGKHYFLIEREKILKGDPLQDAKETIGDYLSLGDAEPTPVMDAYGDAEEAPDRCVVVDGGHVTGFYDVDAPLFHMQTRGEGSRETGDAVEKLHQWLVAEMNDKIRLHETASLTVSLSAEDVDDQDCAVSLPEGELIEIFVTPGQGLVVKGAADGKLKVTRGESSPCIEFKFKAIEAGMGRVRVLALHEGRRIGFIDLVTTVVDSEEAIENGIKIERESRLKIATDFVQPDLTLLIEERPHTSEPRVSFILDAKNPDHQLHYKRFEAPPFGADAKQFVHTFFEDIDDMFQNVGGSGISRSGSDFKRRIANKGLDLFDKLFPGDLKSLLWRLKDKIRSVEILSDEPFIPWELCKLQKEKAGFTEEGPFLCEAFDMTRWPLNGRTAPNLSFENMALVVSDEEDGVASGPARGLMLVKCEKPVPNWIPEERDHLLSLGDGDRKVNLIESNYIDVLEALASGRYDAWHVPVCGSFRDDAPDLSAIELKGSQPLRPDDICGKMKNLGLRSPLVFLNACHVGRGGRGLTGAGGWPHRFIHAGAGAFVGAFWGVSHKMAFLFAKNLYDQLLAGNPLGKAARAARLAIKEESDSSCGWLAYTVYGAPTAVVRTLDK